MTKSYVLCGYELANQNEELPKSIATLAEKTHPDVEMYEFFDGEIEDERKYIAQVGTDDFVVRMVQLGNEPLPTMAILNGRNLYLFGGAGDSRFVMALMADDLGEYAQDMIKSIVKVSNAEAIRVLADKYGTPSAEKAADAAARAKARLKVVPFGSDNELHNEVWKTWAEGDMLGASVCSMDLEGMEQRFAEEAKNESH